MKAGKKIRSSRLLFLCFIQYTGYPDLHSFNHLFNLIKLLPQFLHLVTVSDDGQAPLRNLHRDTPPGIKSRLSQPVAFKVHLGCRE